MNRRLLMCSTAVAAVVILAACGSDPQSAVTSRAAATTATTAAPATSVVPSAPTGTTAGAACRALGSISNFDIQSSQLVTEGDYAAIQKFLIDSTPAVLSAYDEAAAAEPSLKSPIEILRKVTSGARDAAYEAKDMATLQQLLLEIPEIEQATDAATTLNDYAQTNCGFSTGGNQPPEASTATT